VLEQARRSGATDADLFRAYTLLRAENLAQAWAYSSRFNRRDFIRLHSRVMPNCRLLRAVALQPERPSRVL
jgi:hypothetical protein